MDNSISYRILNTHKNLNNNEDVEITERDDKVLITITKEMPTPAYSVKIREIVKESGYYNIYYDIVPPESDLIQLQVITYKTINLEVDKEQMGAPPYNIILNQWNHTNDETPRP